MKANRKAIKKAAKLVGIKRREAAPATAEIVWDTPRIEERRPAPVRKPRDPEKRRKMVISIQAEMNAAQEMRESEALAKHAELQWKAARPPPGVVPKRSEAKAFAAMDDAASMAGAYAATAFQGAGMSTENMVWLGYPYLAELAQRPEYRQVNEIIAKEMTRKWISLKAPGDDPSKADKISKIDECMKKFRIRDLFRKLVELDLQFGRAHLYVDLGNDSPNEVKTVLPLVASKIEGRLKGFRVVEPVWVYPATYNTINPMSPDFYRPSTWWVMGKQYHRTRLLTFISREMPDLLKATYSFGGLSMSQMLRPYIENFLRMRGNVADLVEAFSHMVLATDMSSALDGGSGSDLFKRVDIFNRTRTNRGTMVISKDDEELSNVVTPLGTLDHLLAQAQEQYAGVPGIPLIKLFGITPSGLNASSDGELRNFGDNTEANQEHFFRHHLKTVVDIIQIHLYGEVDQSIDIHFEPLWQLTEVDKASIRKQNADTFAVYDGAGVVDSMEERERLANEDGGNYNGLDLSKVIEPPAPDPTFSNPGGNEDPNAPPTPGAPGAPPAAPGGIPPADNPQKELSTAAKPTAVKPTQATTPPVKPAAAKVAKDRKAKSARFANDEGEFKESDHPRDKSGKFGSGGGSEGGASGNPTQKAAGGGKFAKPAPIAAEPSSTAPATKSGARAPLSETKAGPDGKGRTLADGSPLPAHIEALKLPPAWTDVKVSSDPKSPLQAQGKDAKGRLQSVYSKEFSATQAAAKFERVSALAQQFDTISGQNAEAQKSNDAKTKDSADCLDLIMKMGVRPGSDTDTGAETKAYGATTLKGEHVHVAAGEVTLKFTGKKGVDLSLPVTDPALAAMLKSRARASGPSGNLFPATNDKALLEHTHSLGDGSFKTKDFRTHLGTKTASDHVASMPVPKGEKAYKAAVKEVATKVSTILGNTPVIALQSYINPTIFAAWSQDAK